MKNYTLLALLLASHTTIGQGQLQESWAIFKEGSQMAKDVAWGVALDEVGNIYWATSQTNFGGNRKDIFTYKINQQGEEVWNTPHVFGDNFEQQAYNCVFKNGIAYIAGRTWSGALITSSDALLFAIDTLTQDTLWTYVWDGGFGYEEVDGLVVEEDAIFISGWTWGDTTNQDAFITRLDLNGNPQWTTTWGSSKYDQCDGHCIVDDSTVYICGLYDLSTGGDAYLAAFEKTSGDYKWHKLWGDPNTEDALGMESDGTFLYQCGNTSSFGDSTVFINKYDKNGNLIWTTKTEKAIKTRSLDFANDGTFYLAATTNTLGAGGEDLIIMQFDAVSGSLLEYQTWGDAEDESVQDIRIWDSHMYLTGRTVSFSTNNDEDAFLIKAPLFDFTNIYEDERAAKMVFVYPNPATEYFKIRIPEKKDYSLKIFNTFGKLMREIKSLTENDIIHTSQFESGLYIWQASSDNEKKYGGRLIVNK